MSCCGANKTGPEDDEEDMDGPLEDRSCTDIIFVILFAVFLIGMVQILNHIHKYPTIMMFSY